MRIRIGRTLPPAAAPIGIKDLVMGLVALFAGKKSVRNLEEDLGRFYGCRYCFAVSSGRAALSVILQALHELSPEREEILIPAYTCFSVPASIVKNGLKVSLCDLAPDSLDFDFDSLERMLDNPRLLCVIPTHLYGTSADVQRVKKIATGRDLFVVEDAAQAMGAEQNGVQVGKYGDVFFFSTDRGKALSTVEGGLILTDNPRVGETVQKIVGNVPNCSNRHLICLIFKAIALSLFIHPNLYWLPKALPFLQLGKNKFDPTFSITKMSSFQAGLARKWKEKLVSFQQIRSRNALSILSANSWTQAAIVPEVGERIRLPIFVEDQAAKEKILREGDRRGLGISEGYPRSINEIDHPFNLSYGRSFPSAENTARTLISLPIHPSIQEKEISKIAGLLKELLPKAGDQ